MRPDAAEALVLYLLVFILSGAGVELAINGARNWSRRTGYGLFGLSIVWWIWIFLPKA